MCKVTQNGTVKLGLKEWSIVIGLVAVSVGASLVIGSDRRGLEDHLISPHLTREDLRVVLKQEIEPVLERIAEEAQTNAELHRLQEARMIDLHNRVGRVEGKLWPDGYGRR